ncbi:unnamed protein product [Litomosoides sigmodontis]|uniref:Latrophilin-like protein LAT-2 n=1 Tax=Litomosoides sigmodontis TaxID=42156 RepID=A0A3P6S5P8_LITSI|nr:unnamed protein product [Litomosoides sigmodontis]
MLNSSQAMYAWTQNNYYMKEIDFSEDEQLQPIGSCIEADSQSMFRNWILVNCSNYNYFICGRPVLETRASESQSVVCMENEFEFSCPNGSSIHVDFAAYGNNGEYNKMCSSSGSLKTNVTYWEECIHPSSLQTMISMCQGLTYCRIGNLRSLFPDNPCLPTTPTSLQYRMRCLLEPMTVCAPRAIYWSGRCYVPYVTDKPLSFNKSKTKCQEEGGQLAISVGQLAENEIALAVRKQAGNVRDSCYWMDKLERLEYKTFCKCYRISNKAAFWSQRSCNSSQQWVCQFAPNLRQFRSTEIVFNGLSDVESAESNPVEDGANFRRKRSFCEEYEWNGVTIPRTLACNERQMPCPDHENTIGMVTHKCSCELSEWEGKPNAANCTHKWIGFLDQLIDNSAPAEYIGRKWAHFLQNSTKQLLFGGDLAGSVQISKKLLSLAKVQYAILDDREERNKKALEFTEMYGRAGDELLSDRAVTVWMTLPDDIRILKVSLLISELQRCATMMAGFITEKQKKVEYSNWGQSVQATFVQSVSGLLARPRSRLTPSSPFLLAYYVFRSVGALLNTNKSTITNSLVIGAAINDPTSSILLPESHPVIFKFYHIKINGVSNPRCVFWDTSKNKDGCKTLRAMNDSTECACTHLTSFAILMDIAGLYGHDDKSIVNKVLNLITTIGCIFSIVCLFLASLVFICFRSLWNIRQMIHSNLCFCLLLAELLFLIGIDRIENRAVFEDEEGKAIIYCLFAYGFPAIIVAVTSGMAWSNYGTDQYCWLNVETPTVWAFAGPIAVVIVSNIVFLGVALRMVLSVPHRRRSRMKQMLGWLKGSATLLCLLGITWIFGYLMVIQGAGTVFAYIFTILNCLQGVFIFIIHVILNDKIRSTLLRCIRVNICCMLDVANIPSRSEKFTDMIRKTYDLFRGSSQLPIGRVSLEGLKRNEKVGLFVWKMSPSLMDGKGSPTTMITYLDWKRKLNNGSASIPSYGSGNCDCERKRTFPIVANNAVIVNESSKNSDTTREKKSFPIRRKISYSISDGLKPKQKRSLEK